MLTERKLFIDIPFSLLMALEPDSNIVRETNRLPVIPQGAVAVWRADSTLQQTIAFPF